MAIDQWMIPKESVDKKNSKLTSALNKDYGALKKILSRRKIKIEDVVERVSEFKVAVPSWGLAGGGTRFGSFPAPGSPRDVFEKIDDAALINQLTRATPGVSLHIPWDKTDELGALKKHARARGLYFDAMNSNTFEDRPGQTHSYKFGSLSHVKSTVRDQAIAHNLEVVEIGRKLGSKAITVWVGDGANFPGQASIGESFDRYLDSVKKIYRGLPENWTMFIEYKPFEPAFYYTVLADWGSALMAANEVGERCKVLVDLGHHLPGTNIEAVVARLIRAGKLGGFHLNDSHYADDDLTAASIYPYRLFRVFHELALARDQLGPKFNPAYMIDQSHNIKDPIEALIQTAMEVQITRARSLLVDHPALKKYQDKNDAIMAETTMKEAFNTDVRPITAMARLREGGAIAPIEAYRASGYRRRKQKERKN